MAISSPDAAAEAADTRPLRHRLYEDAIAMLVGTLFVSLGMTLYSKAMLLVGSTAGLSLLLQYLSGYGFWVIFSVVNLPFYILAVKRMGWRFALRTFAAVSLVSLFSAFTPRWIDVARLDPLYATIIGGCLSGTGLLILFRHRTGLGGINILALYLQDHFGIRAGYFQLAVDLAILSASMLVLSPENIALSVLGAAIVNMTLAINHRPERYIGIT